MGTGANLSRQWKSFYSEEFFGIFGVMFHVTEIDEEYEFRFFASQSFSDLSGIGEELGKTL